MTYRNRFAFVLAAVLAGVTFLTGAAGAADGVAPDASAPVRPEPVRRRNAEMKQRVDEWLRDGRAVNMPVHMVYLSCSDQQPFEGYRHRLDRVLTEVQQWMAAQHDAAGFGRTTMALDRDATGRVRLHEGKLPFTTESRHKGNKRQTQVACEGVARKLLGRAGVDYDRSFVLILTTITDDRGAAPFAGRILQDRGYCFAVDTPWLDSRYTKTDGPAVWKGKAVGPANSALIGGIAHELGHGLGLPHSDEPRHEASYGESLMASGNYTWRNERRGEGRGSYLLDTDAMLLIARPPFTGRVRDFDKQPKASVEGLEMASMPDGTIRVSGRVRSDIPVHAVNLYDDPPGSGNYNAVAHAALPDANTGQFTLNWRPVATRGEHRLALYLYHVNGRWTLQGSTMTLGDDGKADLTRVHADWSR